MTFASFIIEVWNCGDTVVKVLYYILPFHTVSLEFFIDIILPAAI